MRYSSDENSLLCAPVLACRERCGVELRHTRNCELPKTFTEPNRDREGAKTQEITAVGGGCFLTGAVGSLKLAAGVVHDGAFIEKWLSFKPDLCPDQGLKVAWRATREACTPKTDCPPELPLES